MRILSLIAVLCALALVGVGCGDDDSDNGGSADDGSAEKQSGGYADGGKSDTEGSASGKAQTVKLSADPGGALKFDKSSLTAKTGKVTIVMDNPSDLPHAVEIEGNGVEVAGETVGNGGVSKASADLKPGEYEFYCPVGNHQAAGMEGTLTVQ